MWFQAWLAISLSIVNAAENLINNEVCYDGVGCFYMGEPWSSAKRPTPLPRDPKTYNIQGLLFQRPYPGDAHRFNLSSKADLQRIPFNPDLKRTVVIVPGRFYTENGGWAHRLKDGFLKHMDANVIIVITEPIMQFNIYQMASDIRVVAAMVANMIAHFKLMGADYKTMHLIGMDFSAHLVSYVSKIHKVGRITGLDPQERAFDAFGDSIRINKGDADFVDIIHTDASDVLPERGTGMADAVGDVDIYVNGGSHQPGCDEPGPISVRKNDTIFSFVRRFTTEWASSSVWCNHVRSALLFEEAVTNSDCIMVAFRATNENVFLGISNSEVEKPSNRFTSIMENCTDETCTAMGMYTEIFPFRGQAVLTTNSEKPFCRVIGPTEFLTKQYYESVNAWFYKHVEKIGVHPHINRRGEAV